MAKLAAFAALAVATLAGGAAAAPAPAPFAFDQPALAAPPGAPPLSVTSAAFKDGGPIPQTYAADGKNISPPVAWSAGPAATKAYVLIMQDPDSENPRPATHWLAYNIPAEVHALNRGARNTAEPTSPLGMLQGWNFHGSVGYSGPRPPVGDPAHHYHIQLFALDRVIHVGAPAQPQAVLAAMRGHVKARGELVGLYAVPTPKPPAPPQ